MQDCGITTCLLVDFDRVDHFYRYKHVLSGYRPPASNWQQSVKSLLYNHNQAWNAWTMLLALPLAILYAALMTADTVVATPVHTLVASLFVVQWWLIALPSALYHTHQNISVEVAKTLLRLDCFGQMCAAVAAQFVLSYYCFHPEPTLRGVLLAISFTVTACYGLLIASSEFDRIAMSRILLLVGPATQGILCLLPIVYSECVDGFERCGLYAELITFVILTSVVLWLLHFPERYYPYKFDTTIHSHVVMHLTLLALQGLQAMYLIKAANEYTV